MRNLIQQEIDDMIAIDGQDYSGFAGQWIEAKVSELAQQNIGTACGGPDSFKNLVKKYQHRKVRGYLVSEPTGDVLIGMICIKIQTETTAEKVEALAGIRWDGEADPATSLAGFMVFEDE